MKNIKRSPFLTVVGVTAVIASVLPFRVRAKCNPLPEKGSFVILKNEFARIQAGNTLSFSVADTSGDDLKNRDSSKWTKRNGFKIQYGKSDPNSPGWAISGKSESSVYFGVDPGLDIGFASFQDKRSTSLSGSNNNLNLNRGKSSNVTLDILKLKVRLDKHRVRLYSGLGIDWTNYRFANDITLQPSNSYPPLLSPIPQYLPPPPLRISLRINLPCRT